MSQPELDMRVVLLTNDLGQPYADKTEGTFELQKK